MATARPSYYCYKCQQHIGHVANYECPLCKDSFIEEVPPQEPTSQPQSSQSNLRRPGASMQYHRSTPFGNQTIFFGGVPPGAHPNNEQNLDLGGFLQTIMGQIAGGLVGTANPTFPFIIQNGGGGPFDQGSLDALLAQFLNQMGENGGPAPAPEDRINAIPTVKITAEQARDNLQCAICMDDFNENDQAKRLPCSHHFHEPCILRWLRLHGTCPTCRVTLDGNNTSNNEYYNFHPNFSSTTNNNRRNDGNNPGSSSSSSGPTAMEFD